MSRLLDSDLDLEPLASLLCLPMLAGAFFQFSRLAPDAGFWLVMVSGGGVGLLTLFRFVALALVGRPTRR